MKHSLAAVATTLALALGACGDSGLSTNNGAAQSGPVGSAQMNLTLPSGVVINTVNYTVSGALLSSPKSGVVNEQNSTQLRFRVGDLPVGNSYTLALGATTVAGQSCAGTAGFNIANNTVTTLTMSLVCGSGVVVEVDTKGDVSVSVDVVNQAGVTCPVVTGISALPLEVRVGSSADLSGFATSTAGVSYSWAGAGGTIAAPTAAATGFLCTTAGDQTLTFGVAKAGCTNSTMPVTVTCTGTAADAGTADAGTTDAGAVVDAGGTDAGTVVDAGGSTDAGTVVDAGPADAGTKPDAGPADAGIGVGGACETCLRTQCSDYSGVDLAGPCFSGTGFDPAFAQKCSDAYVCSHNSADNCAYNLLRGPVGCYCGESVSVDACQTSAANVAGNCQPQWYAATGCAAGDQNCVLNNFINLTLPSGYANFMIECQNNSCATQCPKH